MKEAEIRRGDWADPEAGKVRFGDYAANWISDHVIKPRTEGLYRSQLQNHLAPTFGKKDLRDIHQADIRRWRKERLDAGPHAARPFGQVTVAKAYRLLHAIMNTAVEDGLIRRNPCRITSAGQEYSQERPVVPVGTLVRLIDRFRPATGRCSCSRPSPTCGSGSWPGSGAISSTSISALSASPYQPRKWTTDAL